MTLGLRIGFGQAPLTLAASRGAFGYNGPSLPSAVGRIFPLSVDASNRMLLDASGNRFFIQGMALWEMEVNPTRNQIRQTLDGAQQQGFNAVLVEAAEHLFSFQTPPPQNAEGNIPYTGMTGTSPPYSSVDFSAINAPYWSLLQFIQQETQRRGILFCLCPAYYGFAATQEGWGVGGELASNSNAQLQAYGVAFANAFKGAQNVMVIWGGDNVSGSAIYQQIATGIQSVVSGLLYTGHSARGNDAFSAFGTITGFNVNTQYSNNAGMVGDAATAYARNIPFFLIEDEYENASAQTNQTQRCQKYQSVCSGSNGFFFGQDPMWSHGSDNDSGRQTADVATCISLYLFTTASQQMKLVSQIVKSIAKFLTPQTGTALVTTTLGTGAAAICAALSTDTAAALIYTPAGAGFTVNLAAFSKSSLAAQWFDPTNGAFQNATGTPFANTGTHAFTVPGTNSGGDSDWVLRLS